MNATAPATIQSNQKIAGANSDQLVSKSDKAPVNQAPTGPAMQRGGFSTEDGGINRKPSTSQSPTPSYDQVAVQGAGTGSRFVELFKDFFAGIARFFYNPASRIKRRIEELKDSLPALKDAHAKAEARVSVAQNRVSGAEKAVKDAQEGYKLAQSAGKQTLMDKWKESGGAAMRSLEEAKAGLAEATKDRDEAVHAIKAAQAEIGVRVKEAEKMLDKAEFAELKGGIAKTLDKLDLGSGAMGSELKDLEMQAETNNAHFKLTMEGSGAVARYETEKLKDQKAGDDFLASIK